MTQVDLFLEYIKRETAKYVAELKTVPEVPQKVQALYEEINGNFGCHENAVLNLVEQLAGVDFSVVKTADASQYPLCVALVIDGYKGECGEEGDVVLIVPKKQYCCFTNAGVGNYLKYVIDRAFLDCKPRPATEDEIFLGIAMAGDEALGRVIEELGLKFLELTPPLPKAAITPTDSK